MRINCYRPQTIDHRPQTTDDDTLKIFWIFCGAVLIGRFVTANISWYVVLEIWHHFWELP
jgi:hypothetical protein